MTNSASLSGTGDGVMMSREFFRLPLAFLICLPLDHLPKGLIKLNLNLLLGTRASRLCWGHDSPYLLSNT